MKIAIFGAAGAIGRVIGPLDVPREYVYVPGVAPVVADPFERPELFGRTYRLGGAGTTTRREFITAADVGIPATVEALRAQPEPARV